MDQAPRTAYQEGQTTLPDAIHPDEAWRRIASHIAPLPEEVLERASARGRVLTRPLGATVDVPAADVSAMDGYAVAGEVTLGRPLPVVASVAAGDPPGLALKPGTAARIMTGAPVPPGADRIVPVEASDGGREAVTFSSSTIPGEHIRKRGEIVRQGDLLLPAGARLTPGALALLAAHGHGELPVHRVPRVAVLATGDEVVPAGRTPGPGQLRDTHTDFLCSAGGSLGLTFSPLGIAPDRTDALAALAARGLEADVFLLCGGVSMGEFDLSEGVLASLGCTRLFDAVAIQPGQPLVFATHSRGVVFGLPGNPASVMVCFWLFVRPALRRLMGEESSWWQGAALAATLAAPLPGAGPRDRFLPAEVHLEGGVPRVVPIPFKGSHDLAAFSRGDALVRVPRGSAPREPGSPCEILCLPDWPG